MTLPSDQYVVRPDGPGFEVFDRHQRARVGTYPSAALAAAAAKDLAGWRPWPSDAARRSADAMDALDAYRPTVTPPADPFAGIPGAYGDNKQERGTRHD